MKPNTTDITLWKTRGYVDFAIADGDFSILGSSNQTTTETEYIKTLRDDILLRILSIPGEWLGSSHMGAGIRALVGRPSTPIVLGQIVDRVYIALTRDLRIPPNDLDVQISQHGPSEISVRITIIIDGDPIDMSPGYTFDLRSGLVEVHTGGA